MRICGIETEYGIADPSDPRANPILLSSRLVAACRAQAGRAQARWDYGGEDPLMDLRGVRRARMHATPDMLTEAHEFDELTGQVTLRRRRGSWEDPAHLNAVLANGSRFYVDHAHPEYSGPEVTTAHDAVVWDTAGDRIAIAAAERYSADEDAPLALYKNNVDGKGASYGTHENYLVDRSVDFDALARRVTAHLVTRIIITGAGRVGLGQHGEKPGFQLSQRADYMEAEVGLETTLRRPIVNTRDEPHADRARWRRLHVIIGDANCAEVSTYLKVGTTALVLTAIEADDARLDTIVLEDPVAAVRHVSYDVDLRTPLALATGEQATALEVQRALLEICRDYARDAADAAALARWESVLDKLGRDIFEAAGEVEWVAKLQLLGRMRERYASPGVGGEVQLPGWDDERLLATDLQWGQLGTGMAARLTAAGALERIASEEEVQLAVSTPPRDTRAWLRGRMVSQRPEIVDAAGWASVVLDRETDHGHLEVVDLPDPRATSHPLLDALLGPES